MKDWILRKDANLWTNLLLLLFSVAVATGSYRLGLGSFRHPGPGFITFGASSILGLLALHLCLKAFIAKDRTENLSFSAKRFVRVVLVFMTITSYIILLEPVGYVLATFLLLGSLFRILGKGKLVLSIVGAAFATFLSYIVFSYYLAIQFPKGLFRFFF